MERQSCSELESSAFSSNVTERLSPPTAVLDQEVADESLWQEDKAAPISERERRLASGPNYPVIFWLALLHVGAVFAPWCFSWQAFIATVALYWLTGSIGVCLGYHRLLTHGAFQTYKPVRYLIALIGGLSGEGCAIDWVANHRKHHAHSDHEGDPHSPRDGAWWAHVFWLGLDDSWRRARSTRESLGT